MLILRSVYEKAVFWLFVSTKSIEVDKEKITVIKKWPTPKSITNVRRFHGLDSLQAFVKNFTLLLKL